jgi:hypothetical protein
MFIGGTSLVGILHPPTALKPSWMVAFERRQPERVPQWSVSDSIVLLLFSGIGILVLVAALASLVSD